MLLLSLWFTCEKQWQKIKSNYFIVRLKVDQRAGQLLPHLGITKTEKIELKHETDEQISPVNGLQPRDQSDRQEAD